MNNQKIQNSVQVAELMNEFKPISLLAKQVKQSDTFNVHLKLTGNYLRRKLNVNMNSNDDI